MTHLPYILASYAIAAGVPLYFSVATFYRLRAAQRQLAAIDPRRERGR